MLFVPRFQEFLCLAHTSYQICLFVGQERIARCRYIRMRCLRSFALALQQGTVLLVQEKGFRIASEGRSSASH